MPTINLKNNNIRQIPYKHNNQSQGYYNSKGWKTLRNAYYCSHPLCERCLLKGISKQTDEIHHIIPYLTGKTEDERWRLLLDPNNLQALCSQCHDEVHKQMKKANNIQK